MTVLASHPWTGPFLSRRLRSLLDGSAPSFERRRSFSVQNRQVSSSRTFVSIAVLDDGPSPLANRLEQQRQTPSSLLEKGILEEFSDEYVQGGATTSTSSTFAATSSPPQSWICHDPVESHLPLSKATSFSQHDVNACRVAKDLVKFTSNANSFSTLAHPFVLDSDVNIATEKDTQVAEQLPKVPEGAGTTIFEGLSEEYLEKDTTICSTPSIPLASTSASTSAASTPASTSISTRRPWERSHRVMLRKTGLPELVSSGDFARAESLRTELREADIHIKRHLVYAEAALHAWETKPAPERTESFYNWFSLMPNATIGRIRRSRNALHDVKRRLFSEPYDLNTIACFSLIAARKGFANYISIDIIPHIARFASPGVSVAFFDAYEKSAKAFYSRFHKTTKEDSSFSLWDAERWHNLFVRALCFAGYVDAAVDRLSYIVRSCPGIVVTHFTWIVFLEDLTRLGRMDLISAVRHLRAIATPDPTPAPVVTEENPIRDSPSATYLARMMAEYVESGHSQNFENLRKEMMQTSMAPDLWVTAQMKYYQDKQQYVVVLRQFMEYYACVGVPKEQIDPYTQESSPSSLGKFDNVHPSLPLISPRSHARGLNRWPSTHTLTMVWQSLVSLAEDSQRVGALYRSFLDYWDRHLPSTSSEKPSGFQKDPWLNVRYQYPPVMKPDAVHFHIFVVAFARLAGTEAAMAVLVDMHARDIRPDAHNWTVVAGQYMVQDDLASAEKILKRMETTLGDDDAAPAGSQVPKDATRTLVGHVSRPAGWIPGPTLVTYTAILRGLIDRGRLVEARQFEERMKAAGYVPGSDERTESVLELLQQREGTPRVPWHERAQWQPGYGQKCL